MGFIQKLFGLISLLERRIRFDPKNCLDALLLEYKLIFNLFHMSFVFKLLNFCSDYCDSSMCMDLNEDLAK